MAMGRIGGNVMKMVLRAAFSQIGIGLHWTFRQRLGAGKPIGVRDPGVASCGRQANGSIAGWMGQPSRMFGLGDLTMLIPKRIADQMFWAGSRCRSR